jgi:hypothetical protein
MNFSWVRWIDKKTDFAPGDAAARTPFTQRTTRFINLEHIGKNERFAFTRQTQGETPGLRTKLASERAICALLRAFPDANPRFSARCVR